MFIIGIVSFKLGIALSFQRQTKLSQAASRLWDFAIPRVGGMASISNDNNAIQGVGGVLISRTRVIRLSIRDQYLVILEQNHMRCISVPGPPQFLQHAGNTTGANLDMQ